MRYINGLTVHPTLQSVKAMTTHIRRAASSTRTCAKLVRDQPAGEVPWSAQQVASVSGYSANLDEALDCTSAACFSVCSKTSDGTTL